MELRGTEDAIRRFTKADHRLEPGQHRHERVAEIGIARPAVFRRHDFAGLQPGDNFFDRAVQAGIVLHGLRLRGGGFICWHRVVLRSGEVHGDSDSRC